MFIIEVDRRKRDENITLEDIQKHAEVSHAECYGGEAVWGSTPEGLWYVSCSRCNAYVKFNVLARHENGLRIIRTAIDGKKRRILTDRPAHHEPVTVIQKNLS